MASSKYAGTLTLTVDGKPVEVGGKFEFSRGERSLHIESELDSLWGSLDETVARKEYFKEQLSEIGGKIQAIDLFVADTPDSEIFGVLSNDDKYLLALHPPFGPLYWWDFPKP